MLPTIIWRQGRIYINHAPLVEGRVEDTTLSADSASGSGTLTVKNVNKFAINQILLIGELGEEQSEIIKTHASSAPSQPTITLASNTVFAHFAGTKVYILQYDQVELSHATTTTGSKTTLTTTAGSGIVALEADDAEVVYKETEYSSGYYFARFKDSIAGTFGSYSDPLPYGGWSSSQVGYLIDVALRRNKTEFNDTITRPFCYEEINSCLQLTQGKLKRFAQNQSLNAILGQTSRGVNTVTLPTDIYDTKTLKSLPAVRIGDGADLEGVEEFEFERRLGSAISTTSRTQASVSATSLTLTNSYDFADSGSVTVFVSNTKYTITYTGVTRDTSTGGTAALTGVPASGTGSITVIIPAGTNVWQNEQEGTPTTYTVRGGAVEFWPLPDGNWDNMNVRGDYWKVATSVDSEGDTIDAGRFDMVLSWLVWKIRMHLTNNGKLDQTDGDYLDFKERMNDGIRTEPVIARRMQPRINTMNRAIWPPPRRSDTNTN